MSYSISKDDFGCSKEHCTYKINYPGVYKLKEDISFNPKKNKVAAIIICSSNVTLDLNGKTLKQSSKNDKTQITGIIVKSGHRNVTILGNYGVVKNFSQRGIYVEGSNDFITLGDDTLLTISGCGYGTEKAFVENNSGVTQCGLQLGEQEWSASVPFPGFNNPNNMQFFNGILNELIVKNITCSQNNIGCILGEGNNYYFSGCSFSKNLEYRLGWEKVVAIGGFYKEKTVLCYGLGYTSNPKFTPEPNVGVNNATFENCKFNNNKSEGNDTNNTEGSYCNGFTFTNNFKNLKVINCQFNQNETVLGQNGIINETIGFVIGAGVGTVVENSEFSDNKGGSKTVGCVFSGQTPNLSGTNVTDREVAPSESTTVRNCVASRNLAATEADLDFFEVAGFRLVYPSGATLINCVSEDNKLLLTQANKDKKSSCHGIILFSDQKDKDTFTNNVEIRDCKLSRNRVTTLGTPEEPGPTFGSSSGVRVLDDLCENIIIRNCVISDNRADFDEPQPSGDFLTTGVDLFNEEVTTGPSFVTVCDNIIQSNGQVGIDNNLENTTIQGNKLINHLGSGVIMTDGKCGTVIENTILLTENAVIDESVGGSTTLVANNKSYNTPCGYTVDYLIPEVNGLRQGTLNSFPSGAEVNDNIEINNPNCLECNPVQQLSKNKFDSKKYRDSRKKFFK